MLNQVKICYFKSFGLFFYGDESKKDDLKSYLANKKINLNVDLYWLSLNSSNSSLNISKLDLNKEINNKLLANNIKILGNWINSTFKDDSKLVNFKQVVKSFDIKEDRVIKKENYSSKSYPSGIVREA